MNAPTKTLELPNSLSFTIAGAALKRAGRQRRRVAFLIHSPETYSALEPVVRQLRNRPEHFELLFFALPRNFTGRAGDPCSGLETCFRFLARKGLEPIALAGRHLSDLETLIRLAPDFVFRQAPWDNDVPPVFDSSLLSFTNLCYVPYGVLMVDEPLRQYNQPFHNACDLIFSETEFHHSSYREHRALGLQGVHHTGHPRLEQFTLDLERLHDAAWPLASASEDTPRLIWAPHHTFARDWLNLSTFLIHRDAMLNEARRGRVSILLRPHPALRQRLVSCNLMSADAYDDYLRQFAAAGCSGVDAGEEYIASFAASDALITDGLGFFAEYMLTGKPLIRTRRADGGALNAFANWLVEACDDVHDGAQLQATLDALGDHCYVDPHAAARLERRDRLLAQSSGASQRIADTLQAW